MNIKKEFSKKDVTIIVIITSLASSIISSLTNIYLDNIQKKNKKKEE